MNIVNLKLLAVIALASLSTACAVRESSTRVFADYDPGTRFDNYRTFTWESANPLVVATSGVVDPRLQPALMKETSAQLSSKGLREVKSRLDADLLVAFTIGSTDSLQENNFPGSVQSIGTVGQSYRQSSEIREVTTGLLSVDLFNRTNRQRVWTGWAATGLTIDVRINQSDEVEDIIALIMEQFPPSAVTAQGAAGG
jgi:hypothetical protein